MNTWATYLRSVIGDRTQDAVAARAGIHYTTLNAWLRDRREPSAEAVIDFARSLGLSPPAALIAAGYLTAKEAGLPDDTPVNPAAIPSDVLLAELVRRNNEQVVA